MFSMPYKSQNGKKSQDKKKSQNGKGKNAAKSNFKSIKSYVRGLNKGTKQEKQKFFGLVDKFVHSHKVGHNTDVYFLWVFVFFLFEMKDREKAFEFISRMNAKTLTKKIPSEDQAPQNKRNKNVKFDQYIKAYTILLKAKEQGNIETVLKKKALFVQLCCQPNTGTKQFNRLQNYIEEYEERSQQQQTDAIISEFIENPTSTEDTIQVQPTSESNDMEKEQNIEPKRPLQTNDEEAKDESNQNLGLIQGSMQDQIDEEEDQIIQIGNNYHQQPIEYFYFDVEECFDFQGDLRRQDLLFLDQEKTDDDLIVKKPLCLHFGAFEHDYNQFLDEKRLFERFY